MRVLVTGGAGFIGSHTTVELINSGYDVVVVDNLCNSSEESLNRVKEITGVLPKFYKVDMLDEKALDEIFDAEDIESVIHFAGLKAVGESWEIPLTYFDNNLKSTLNLLKSMKKHGVRNLVFSSSATVYGKPESVPIREDFPLSVSNPYGRTKLIIEDMLRDIYTADNSFNIALLRYFNPIGAHESGLMGEDPNGIPNNLVPYVAKVAAGKLECINVFGNDYDTPDGTGVRDYIHVMDLAEGHTAALKKLSENPGLVTYNLGTGIGYSVLDVIHAFEKACGKELPYKIAPRRAGDIDECYADPKKAREELHWEAKRDLKKMCEDSWRWQSQNPNGYK
ncbi:MAG: UDP-glucose 4-epimerase GalE [Lachnospiraceae bacterium]|nr:UDP-glucose 4-epimerase GalE [Lachnospiraceae bacterium]